jgi:actin related protein 2/3 complex subunit 2
MSKKNTIKGMILLAPNNRILKETVKDQICRDPEEKRQTMLDVKLCDFDEVSYNIKIDGSGDNANPPMIIAISCPAYHQIQEHSDVEIKNTFAGIQGVTVLAGSDVPEMYDTALSIDLENLPSEAKDKTDLVQKLSMFKYTLMSGPFRKYFTDLIEGKKEDAFKFDIRSDTTIYFCPRSDRCTLVYAVDYQDKVDKVLARIFMQELVDAKKRVRSGPPIAWSHTPPNEIHSQGCTTNTHDILGYASLSLMVNHVKGAKQDQVIGALINFRTFIQYHLKCAKSYFHSRMRKRCSDLLKILNRAKVSFGVKQKKTKSGKTFTRS